MAPVENLLDLAAKAQQAGKLHEAESLLLEAQALDPAGFRGAFLLSVVLRLQGRIEDAAEAARKTIQLRPHAMEGHLQLGLCELAHGHFPQAAASFATAIKIKPDLAPLHHNYGLCLENMGDLKGAAEAFRASMRLSPQDVRSRISLGSLMLAEGTYDRALELAQMGVKLDPTSSDAQVFLAKCFSALRKDEEAEKAMRQAIALNPNSPLAHSQLGFRLLQKGDFTGSEACFRRSIELDTDQGMSYFGITQGRKLTEADRELISKMESVLQSAHISYEEMGYLAYGLAKAHDNLGQYEAAMSHYHQAQNFSYFIRGGKPLDREEYRENIDTTIEIYSRELMESGTIGHESTLPIFILGMMRSGTTLTEQILSSHPIVGAAGEHGFWPHRAHEADDRVQKKFNPTHAKNLGREYCRDLNRALPGAKRVTDKNPGNYQRVGLIHLALPNAKIIHTRRNPIDTCLSIYFTPNPTPPTFAHSPSDIVYAYRQYLRLMEHWRALLPASHFLEIDYEELVADPETNIRRMVEFCELEWDDACLSHHKNAKAVRTPSLWQVRQPMYKSSAGRWKNYEPWLGEFKDLLELPD